MSAQDAELIDVRKRIALALEWVDRHGLVDAGIHLNEALQALDRESSAIASQRAA